KPTVTKEPTPSAKPDETEKPTVTAEPTPSAKPGETEKPAVTKEPGADSDLSGKEFTYGNLRYVVSGKTAVVTGAVKKNVTKVNIPASVKWNKTSFKVSNVSDRAFKNYKKLKNVIIGKNVSTLGKESFSGCSKLTKVTVNSKVLKRIGKSAFNKTAKNMKLYVPKSRYVKYTKKVFKGKGLAGSVKYYKRKG
ncbi:MAG: leucine-rich repeat protein, partial [Lachnospiraceae bacterium]|nr:leucine-rich repeat protein [Lachnospiraceae bacterium]